MQQTAQKEIEKEYISKTEFYLNSRINDLQFLISEMREDIKNLENKFDKKIDETNKRVDNVRDELLQKIDETNRRIDSARIELNQRVDETNNRIDGLFTLLITAIVTAWIRSDSEYNHLFLEMIFSKNSYFKKFLLNSHSNFSLKLRLKIIYH